MHRSLNKALGGGVLGTIIIISDNDCIGVLPAGWPGIFREVPSLTFSENEHSSPQKKGEVNSTQKYCLHTVQFIY